MKKSVLCAIIAILVISLGVFALSSCDTSNQTPEENDSNNNSHDNANTATKHAFSLSTTLENCAIDNNRINITVDNKTEAFSFINAFLIPENYKWELHYDKSCLPDLNVVSKSIDLDEGDNILYALFINKNDTDDIYLYEILVHRAYSVNLNYYLIKSNGTITNIKTETIVANQNYTLSYVPEHTFFEKGYGFSHYENANGEKINSVNIDLPTNVYIVQKVNQYTVTFDTNGGSFISPQSVTYNAQLSLPSAITRAGYKLAGWRDEFGNLHTSSNIKYTFSQNSTFKAEWEAVEYIAYYYDGNTLLYTDTCNYGNTYFVNADNTADYVSQRWSINGTIYQKGNSFCWNTVGDIYLYAKADVVPCANNNYSISIVGENATITRYTGEETSLNVPSLIYKDGKFYTVKAIGDRAFENCSFLSQIIIPDSIESIGSSAFANCSKLVNITIPESVRSIGDKAFMKCESLSTVNITNLIKWYETDFGNTGNPLVFADTLYLNGTKVTDYSIPTGVHRIGTYALGFQDKLTHIEIPDGVVSIGNYAFYGSTTLKTVTIPESVTSIGEGAFYCSGLTSITIPKNVEQIGFAAFMGCDTLKSVTFDDPFGWYTQYYSDTTHNFTAAELSQPLTAASLIRQQYYRFTWYKN